MKKIIIITIVALISVVASANAQNNPTTPRPTMKNRNSWEASVKTFGTFTEESVEVKIENKKMDFWRLTGPFVKTNIGYAKDGLDFSIGGGYQMRVPKQPWMRMFIFEAAFGAKQLKIDGKTDMALYGSGGLMLDIMTLAAPKSRVILNIGGGFEWNHVKYDLVIPTSEDKGMKHTYNGSAWAPMVKAQIGYDFGRRFSIVGEVSYSAFEVQRAPVESINYSSIKGSIGFIWRIGRK